MGIIHDGVFHTHLSKYPGEREFILPFLTNFDVTFAQRRFFKGIQLSFYLLNPDPTIRDQFGITSELILAISDFKTVQPRTMQAIEDIFQSPPAKGRVDQTTFFIVTKGNCRDWILDYCAFNQQPRIPISISYQDIQLSKSDQWFVRTIMSNQLYARDLFNEQLPLVSDQHFFGREKIVADLINAAKLSQNRGLFGLRKTGKTSILFKFKRIVEEEDVIVLYYDCKDPSIRSLSWIELLDRISVDVMKETKKLRLSESLAELHVSERFRQVIRSCSGTGKICIVFDEIEYISPFAKLDAHWSEQFIPFWQTIWTTQSQTRKLSFVIAGVNPSVIELDLVNDIQNPIFSIISPEYLTGLSDSETRSMMHFFGKRMGLKFDHVSCEYIFSRYGGHPMLTRMAGSFVNSAVIASNIQRPYNVTRPYLLESESARESEMAFYCRHIINELRLFYPDEYEMLEMLSSGNEADFIDMSREPNLVRHLENYGLVAGEKGKRPEIKIPVLSKYLNNERIRKSESNELIFSVPENARENWLTNRKIKIIADSRVLEAVVAKAAGPAIYGENGFPEAEMFSVLGLCDSKEKFTNFINQCNRCFVESVENLGKKLGKRAYLYEDIFENYPHLQDAFVRIKLYRNDAMHLLLFDNVDRGLRERIERDFKGQKLRDLSNPYSLLQQVVLDGLFVGFQLEIDSRS